MNALAYYSCLLYIELELKRVRMTIWEVLDGNKNVI